MRDGADAPGWSRAPARCCSRAADEMHAERRRSATSSGPQLGRQLDEVRLIELCMLIGHYEMLAMTLNTLGSSPSIRSGRLG